MKEMARFDAADHIASGLGPAFLLITVSFSGKAHHVQLAHCNYDADQAGLGLQTLYQMRKLFYFYRI
jgi:hypothetical protein